MTCKRFEHWAGLYAGGELDRRLALKLERHLTECPACHDLVEGLRETEGAIKGLRDETLSPSLFLDLRQKVRQAIEDEPTSLQTLSLLRARWQWTVVVSLAVLLTVTALSFFLPRAPDTPEPLVEKSPAASSPTTPQSQESPETGPLIGGIQPVEEQEHPERTMSALHAASQRPGLPETETKPADSSIARTDSDDLVVKLVTDNPNVVIYWLVERNGG
jgi:hypothetical protein